MALYDLPPWLTRQYDFAGGFRSIGDAVVRGMQRRRALELQAQEQQERSAEAHANREMRERIFNAEQKARADELGLRRQERLDRLDQLLKDRQELRDYRQDLLKSKQSEMGGTPSTERSRFLDEFIKLDTDLNEPGKDYDAFDPTTSEDYRRKTLKRDALGMMLGVTPKPKATGGEGDLSELDNAKLRVLNAELRELNKALPSLRDTDRISELEKERNAILKKQPQPDAEVAPVSKGTQKMIQGANKPYYERITGK